MFFSDKMKMHGMKETQNKDIPIFIDSDVAPRLFLLKMKKIYCSMQRPQFCTNGLNTVLPAKKNLMNVRHFNQ